MNHTNKQYLFSTMRCLATHFGVEIDVQKLRRLTSEIGPGLVDDPSSLSGNLTQLAEQFGFRINNLNANASQIDLLLAENLPIIASMNDEHGDAHPMVILRRRGSKYLVWDTATEKSIWLPVSRLLPKLTRVADGTSANPQMPVGIAQQLVVGVEDLQSSASSLPLRWLWKLLRPDSSDILVVILFSVIVAILALATPITVEALVNTVAFGRYVQPVFILSFMLFVLLGFRAALIGISTYIVEIIQRRLFVRVVADLAYRLPKLKQSVFDQHYVPQLLNQFFDVVTVQKVVVSFLLDGVSLVMQALVGMAVLAFYHPLLLGYDVVLMFFLVIFLFALGRGAVKTSIKESKSKYYVAGWLQEIGRAPTAFRRNAGSQLAHHHSDELAHNYILARSAHFRILLRQISWSLAMQAIASTGLLALGGWLVIQGELTLGQLVAAELIVTIIVGSVAKLGKHMEAFYDALASADKLRQILTLPTEEDGYHIPQDFGQLGDIRCGGASYAFDRAKVMIPDFHLTAGDSLAVVGGPGSGKSTLIQLLAGLRLPSSGNVHLAGVCTNELNMSLAAQEIGLAAGSEIIAGTVAENVHLDRANVRSADIRNALTDVGLLQEIEHFPEGLETKLSNLGQPLTSSQCLRLMLARAIVVRPKLLLIDGTLDGLSDACIEPLLEKLFGDQVPWTVVVSTGRQSIQGSCNNVLQLGTAGSGMVAQDRQV